MNRQQVILYENQLRHFIYRLRYVVWVSIGLSLLLFISSIIFLYYKMLLSAVITATLAYLSFRLLWSNAVIITRKWVQRGGGQEEMLYFLDKEMKGIKPRKFFNTLERALEMVEGT